MAAIRSSTAFLILVLLLAACRAEPQPAEPPRRERLVAGHCEARRFEGSAFTACRYDARAHELALFLDRGGETLRSVDRLEAALGTRRTPPLRDERRHV
jgi:uncharacterized protein YigE (DUF2233 family)